MYVEQYGEISHLLTNVKVQRVELGTWNILVLWLNHDSRMEANSWTSKSKNIYQLE